jgi:hypothetical protein
MPDKSQIPVGTQFSPALISLTNLVPALIANQGDRQRLLDAINSSPVRISAKEGRSPTRRTRSLPLEAAVQYGLVEKGTLLATELTHALAKMDEAEQHDAFARHILLKLGGLRVAQGAEEMLADGRQINGDNLARHLTEQGFFLGEHNTAINTLRKWLAKAGVFPESGKTAAAWIPDRAQIERLIGLSRENIAALVSLSDEQRAFALALARRNPTPGEWIPADVIRDSAEATAGVRIARASLPNSVLKPLQSAGLIDFQTGGTKSGKPSRLRTTDRFGSEVLIPFLEHTASLLDPSLTEYLRQRPSDIRVALDSPSKNIAGEALEAFAIQVMRTLGLAFEAWQRRASDTGWGEVDVLLSGVIGCLPTRWQVQCKNTSTTLSHEVVAREVGLVPHTGATHILIMTRGRFSPNATNYAASTFKATRLPIYLIDGPAFDRILSDPSVLARELRAQSLRMIDSLRQA